MNPRHGQYALAGTLTSWTRLEHQAMSRRQARALRRVYVGREPRVFSRYGSRQWAAALPGSRLVVKDPFALLSLPAIVDLTGARPVVVFRHPAALLASYRRMGWRPAVEEMARCLPPGAAGPVPSDPGTPQAMGWFWAAAYECVLADLDRVPDALLVHHAELTSGGEEALSTLLTACGWPAESLHARARTSRPGRSASDRPVLHDFDRSPDQINQGWRETLSPEDVHEVERQAQGTWLQLVERRLVLSRDAESRRTP
jgi:hypothetical protein